MMLDHKKQEGTKIPHAQVMWQILEVVMNIWLLYELVTSGISPPLVVWTILEVGMNFWILVTMFQVGLKKIKRWSRTK